MKKQPFIQRIYKIPAHVRIWIGFAIALIVFILTGRTPPAFRFILVWSSFTFTILVLLWITILTARSNEVRLIAKMQDTSRTITFTFVLFASFVSLFTVILVLRILGNTKEAGYAYQVGFSILSVILSWNLIHTVFAVRYTHLYYNLLAEENNSDKDLKGGLIFPTNNPPDYLELVYFSYTIGMAFQVSDIQITSRRIRHLVLFHAILSFTYNTVILALGITIISGLIQK
jgi:uncharacterized membrane protein